jgi:hypothetical protein
LLESGAKPNKILDHILESKTLNANQINSIKLLCGERIDGVVLNQESLNKMKAQMAPHKNSFLNKLINRDSVTSVEAAIELIPSFIKLGADVNGKSSEVKLVDATDQMGNKAKLEVKEEQTPMVAFVEKWNADTKFKNTNKKKYQELGKVLVMNGALPNEKVERTYEQKGKKVVARVTALQIMDNDTSQAQNFAEFKDVLIAAQGEFGSVIRSNRLERIKEFFNNFMTLNSEQKSSSTPSNREEMRKRQKDIGKAIRGSR